MHQFTFKQQLHVMKIFLYFFAMIILASCSTAYKSGQTPDDLYYAKAKTIEKANVRTEVRDEIYEDRQIRMAAIDARWRTLDDRYEYDHRYSPYSYGYNNGYYYNPYYYPYPVYTPGFKYVSPLNTTIRSTNLKTYNNTITTYTPSKGAGNVRTTRVREYNRNNDDVQRNNSMETRTYENRTYNPPANNNSNSNSNSNRSNTSSGSGVIRPERPR